MQITIIAKELIDGVETTHVNMTVELKCHPDVAVNWAATGITNIVRICTDNEEDDEPPVYKVTLNKVRASVSTVVAIEEYYGISTKEADDIVEKVKAGTPHMLKEGLDAKAAMDLSDVFHELGCEASISS